MGLFKSAAAVAAINLRYWLKDKRVRFLLIVIGYLVIETVWPLTKYGLDYDRSCTPWLLPYLFQSGTVSMNLKKVILHVGLILLLCNAPFFFPTTPYTVLRSRRNGWWIGECMYIVAASLLYTVFLAVLCFAVVLPVVSFGHDWGLAIRDMLFGNGTYTASELNQMYSNYYVMSNLFYYLDPWKAQIYSFFAIWASFSVLGLLMYLISLLQKSAVLGMAAAAIVTFLDPILLYNSWRIGYWIEALSPVCWTDAGRLQDVDSKYFLTIPFVAVMYLLLIALLCVGIWRVSRRVTIEVIEER